MTVRFYSSLDAGAPSLSGSRNIDRIKQILLACLVNGYGSTPAAGWTVGHEHADGFSLGNDEGFVNFVNLASFAVVCYVMEAITDGSTALATGVNRRSGHWFDGSTNVGRQMLYAASFATGANPHWAVVADDKTCILLIGSSTSGLDANPTYSYAHYFGAYRNTAGNPGFCSLGGLNTSSSTGSGQLINFSGMMLRHPFTGLVDQGSVPLYTCLGASYIDGAVVSRNTVQSERLTLVRAGVYGYGDGVSGTSTTTTAVFCGLLRGLVSDPVLASTRASQALPLLGCSDTWQARVTVITLANGKQLVPLYPTLRIWASS